MKRKAEIKANTFFVKKNLSKKSIEEHEILGNKNQVKEELSFLLYPTPHKETMISVTQLVHNRSFFVTASKQSLGLYSSEDYRLLDSYEIEMLGRVAELSDAKIAVSSFSSMYVFSIENSKLLLLNQIKNDFILEPYEETSDAIVNNLGLFETSEGLLCDVRFYSIFLFDYKNSKVEEIKDIRHRYSSLEYPYILDDKNTLMYSEYSKEIIFYDLKKKEVDSVRDLPFKLKCSKEIDDEKNVILMIGMNEFGIFDLRERSFVLICDEVFERTSEEKVAGFTRLEKNKTFALGGTNGRIIVFSSLNYSPRVFSVNSIKVRFLFGGPGGRLLLNMPGNIIGVVDSETGEIIQKEKVKHANHFSRGALLDNGTLCLFCANNFLCITKKDSDF